MILKIGFLLDTENISVRDVRSQLQSQLMKITDPVYINVILMYS